MKNISIILGCILYLGSTVGWADQGITFCNVCDNLKLSQKGDDLTIICPPKTEPYLTFKNCPGAKAKKSGGVIFITCPTWSTTIKTQSNSPRIRADENLNVGKSE